MNHHLKSLVIDFLIIAGSIYLAIFISQIGAVDSLLNYFQNYKFVASFLAGIFFISVFTAAPSLAFILELFKTQPVFEVAIFCALGAMVGDLIIFKFIKDSLATDIIYLIKSTKQEKLIAFFHRKFFHWFIPLIGAAIIASPLPDEIGLAMLGLSKTKTKLFLPLSFALNFAGILVIGLVAAGIK